MSRLFPDRYIVAMGATHVAVDVRSRVSGRHSQEIIKIEVPPFESEGHWRFALQALQSFFANMAPSTRCLDAVFSDQYFQFVLIPWSDQIMRPAERENFARIQLEMVYGAAARDTVKIANSGYGEPALACAIDGKILHELHDFAESNHVRLDSAVPHFMLVFNRWRHLLIGDCVLLSSEADHCILLFIKDALPYALRSLQVATHRQEPFSDLVERELLLHDVDDDTRVYCYGVRPGELGHLESYEVIHLQLPGADEDVGATAMIRLFDL